MNLETKEEVQKMDLWETLVMWKKRKLIHQADCSNFYCVDIYMLISGISVNSTKFWYTTFCPLLENIN